MKPKTTTEADIGPVAADTIKDFADKLLGMAIDSLAKGANISRASSGLLLLSRLVLHYQAAAPREVGALLRAMAAIGQLHAAGASAAVAEGHYACAHEAVLDACDLAASKPEGNG